MSEAIGVSKTNGAYEFVIFHYWNFFEINFRFQLKVCGGCHDLLQGVLSFKDVAVVTVKGNIYRIRFWHISKDAAIYLLVNVNLTEKEEILENIKIYYHI